MDPSTSSSLDSDLPSYNTDILVIVPNDQLEGDGQLKEQGRGWVRVQGGVPIFSPDLFFLSSLN